MMSSQTPLQGRPQSAPASNVSTPSTSVPLSRRPILPRPAHIPPPSLSPQISNSQTLPSPYIATTRPSPPNFSTDALLHSNNVKQPNTVPGVKRVVAAPLLYPLTSAEVAEVPFAPSSVRQSVAESTGSVSTSKPLEAATPSNLRRSKRKRK